MQGIVEFVEVDQRVGLVVFDVVHRHHRGGHALAVVGGHAQLGEAVAGQIAEICVPDGRAAQKDADAFFIFRGDLSGAEGERRARMIGQRARCDEIPRHRVQPIRLRGEMEIIPPELRGLHRIVPHDAAVIDPLAGLIVEILPDAASGAVVFPGIEHHFAAV